MLTRLGMGVLLFIALSCASFHPSALSMVGHMDMMLPSITPTKWLVPITGDSHAAYLPKLITFIEYYGVTVVDDPSLDSQFWGWYQGDMAMMGLNPAISPNAKVATLAHEVGHMLGPIELGYDGPADDFAEAVSFRYCQEIGLDISRSAFTFLNNNPERSRFIITKYHTQIDRLVAKMVAETR